MEVTDSQRNQIQYLATSTIHYYANDDMDKTRIFFGRLYDFFADIERDEYPEESDLMKIRATLMPNRSDEETDALAAAFALGVACERVVSGRSAE